MYEKTSKEDYKSNAMLDMLIDLGYLRKVEFDVRTASSMITSQVVPIEKVEMFYGKGIAEAIVSTKNKYLGNGKPLESNVEAIAKEFLGICEPKDQWKKELKAARDEYGHDIILESFYEWACSQNNFMGKKPVSAFLRNVSQNVVAGKPSVSNPLLDRAEQQIAYISDNKVFFTGEYRFKLALLIKEHGLDLVIQAFANFFQDVEPKGWAWAARDFLQRANVMITVIKQKEQDIAKAERAVKEAYNQAKTDVEPIEEEDEEL